MEGKPLSVLLGSEDEWQTLMHAKSGFTDREVFIKGFRGVLQLVANAKPIMDSRGEVQGIIFVFQEINRIRRLVNRMAGSQAKFTFEDILGGSNAIHEAKKLGMLAAAGKSNVLLLGETGTGKELFAHSIHNHSKRRQHPFVTINCGAIPRELLESELFGYVEGSFTGARRGGRPGKLELADGGTVFLDEIGDMPVDMQVKLLRVLQSGEVYRIGQHKPISVDLRIIAASHFDLKQEVGKGSFREDLFYRLNVLPIYIPPLRERPEDIMLLARHTLKRYSQVLNKPSVRFSSGSEQVLLKHPWPGNVRELENVIERAVNLVEGLIVEPRHFGLPASSQDKPNLKNGHSFALKDMEREIIAQAIKDTGCNLASAAKALGVSRATLYKKIKKFNIPIHRMSA
jgi:transcriptional regulator with PAS, ATPase and Fis domain